MTEVLSGLPSGGANAVDRQVIEAVEMFGRHVFHDYQSEATGLSHVHDLLVIPKGRRTGITWGFAGDDVVEAATGKGEGGQDVFYMGPSHDMAREYIDACAGFAKALMGLSVTVGEFMFKDEKPGKPGEPGDTRAILAYRIDFASGHTIQALTSAPRSFRGRQGKVRIDEAAFVDNLDELLKAAMAFVILGGKVVVISTHNGVDNPFNKLIQEILSGERGGHVYEVPFRRALAGGIYEREARKRGLPLTEEAKAAWVAKIYKLYGSAATEELDAVPSRSSGSWLPYDLLERAERPGLPVRRLSFDDDFTTKPDYLRHATVLEWCERELKPILAKIGNNPVGYGDDFARSGDLSVLWLLMARQDKSWTTPLVVEMRNVPFTEQVFVRVYILKRLRLWKGKGDANGNGASTAERLLQIFGGSRYEALKARPDWWRLQGPPLKERFENDRIEIPADLDISADIRSVKVVNGAPAVPEKRANAKGEEAALQKGKLKRHGDAAVALFHASAALREGPILPADDETVQSLGQTGAPEEFYGDLDPWGQGELTETVNLRGY